jgi:hypothetical protein
LVVKNELLYSAQAAVDNTGKTFSFSGVITPLSTIAIAIKNSSAAARTITFEALDRNGVYTALECTDASSSTSKATQTTATDSEVWYANVSAFVGIRIKVTAFTTGTLDLTVTLIS